MRNCSPSGRGQQKWIRSNEGYRIESPRKDEDLALFHDMHTRENKNFLHPSTDDIEASLPTKLGGLTGFRISASQTPPWKGNDLLATDSEKNDYDWLLTPPGTPLFPSLDKDSLQTYMDRGVLTQPYSASKVSRFLGSNTTELQHKNSRRSPGPRTPTSTVSSTSSSNTFSRNRAPSPSRVNSSPTLRPATPAKTLARSTTMLNRASARSSPPILRRTNTSPSVRSSSAERNAPPLKGRSRGASVSPKLQAWQAPELGFSAEPPPNLRTSLDRPTSSSRSTTMRPRPGTHVEARHSYSEALDSRQSHAVDSRQSLWRNSSSSASKVSSSTTSQDRWSSRGSVMSSSDDGTDVMEPNFLDFSATSPSSTSGMSKTLTGRFDNELSSKCSPVASWQRRSSTSSNLETAGISSTSARKSLEPSMQRVDNRRISQTMFRPLLSSAPTTSFYNMGQTVVRHRPASSLVEPSFTASSNASSEKGARIFPSNESSDDGEGEVESKWDKSLPPEPAKSIEVTENDAIHEEDNKAQDHAAQYDRESVADSASSVMDVTVDCEVGTTMYLHTLDWPAHEACMERSQTNCEAASLGGSKSSLLPMSSIKVVEHDCIDEDDVGLTIQHVHTNQVFVDIQEDISMQQKGTPWLYCDSVNHHQCYHGLDKPEFSNYGASPNSQQPFKQQERFHELDKPELSNYGASPDSQEPFKPEQERFHELDKPELSNYGASHNSQEPFKPEQERFHEATCKARKESNVRSPQRNTITQVCLNTKQSPHGRNLSTDQPVNSITNASMSATMSCQEEASLHPPKMVDFPLSVKPASLMEDPDGRQLQVADLPKSPIQEIRDIAVMDDVSSERPYVMEKTSLCFTNNTEGVPRLGHSEMEEIFPPKIPTSTGHHHSSQGHKLQDPSTCPSTPSSQEQEASPQQPELASQDSCREYYIDMPEIQENVNNREQKGSTFITPRKLSYVENESTFDSEKCLGINKVDYSSVQSKNAVNLNEVGEQLKQVLSQSDDTQASFLKEEHNSSHGHALTNGLSSSLQDFNEQFDGNMNSTADLNFSTDMDGGKSSESCVASAEVSDGVYEFHQIELQKLHGDELSKTWVLSEDSTQSSDEAQPHSSSELLSTQTDSQETVLFANNSQVLGEEDTGADMNALLITEGQQQPHSTVSPLKTLPSPGWKPETPSFSLEEATNTILFCSSIVHDMVYKATSIATEKEAVAIAAAAPLAYQVKRHISNTDFISSLRGKVSKSGTRKARSKEGKSSVKKPEGEDSTKVPVTITEHPTPIDGMEKGPANMEAEKPLPDNAKEKSFMGLSVNSNCQCSVM